MAVGLKNIYFVLLLTFFTTVYAASETKGCEKPLVRREWRSLSEGERKEWIDAVKVRILQVICFAVANSAVVSWQEAPQVFPDAHRQCFHLADWPNQSR